MFHTFQSVTVPPAQTVRPTPPQSTSDGSTSSTHDTNVDGAVRRRRRRNGFKACDRCRTLRIKCGDKPCTNCTTNRAKCHTSDVPPKSTDSGYSTASNSRPPSAVLSPCDTDLSETIHLNPRSSRRLTSNTTIIREFFQDGPSSQTDMAVSPFPRLPHLPPPIDQEPFVMDDDQQRYFLRLFWDHCHPYFPIIPQEEFDKLYNANWGKWHTFTALENVTLDCLTALGMQVAYQTGLHKRVLDMPFSDKSMQMDKSWPGFNYFRRAQEVMRRNTDKTVASLRCYGFLAQYLCKGGHIEGAYNIIGVGVRRALMVNLHRRSADTLPSSAYRTAIETWWLLFQLDAECSLHLEAPISAHPSSITCSQPSPSRSSSDLSRVMGSNEAGEYTSQRIKFSLAVAEIGSSVPSAEIYEEVADIAGLERRALALSRALTRLDSWQKAIPHSLAPHRINTQWRSDMLDRPALLNLHDPPGLQRQRIMLMLIYHHAHVQFQRPFLCYAYPSHTLDNAMAEAKKHADSSIEHAITVIHVTHFVCTASDLLYGWPEMLQLLWDVTQAVLAYALTSRVGTGYGSPHDTRAVAMALAIFDLFTEVSSAAGEAARVIRRLSASLYNFGGDMLPSRTLSSSATSSIGSGSISHGWSPLTQLHSSDLSSTSSHHNPFDLMPPLSSSDASNNSASGLPCLSTLLGSEDFNFDAFSDSDLMVPPPPPDALNLIE